MIGVVDVEVHSTEADDLVELVSPLIDDAESGHEDPDFTSAFMNALRDLTAGFADGTFWKKGLNCLTDV